MTVVSSSLSEDNNVGDDVVDESDGPLSMSVGGSSGSGGGFGGRREERRVWTARNAWCLPMTGWEVC
jgi:hypothetical protein